MKWETLAEKDIRMIWKEHIVLIPRTPRKHNGGRGGVMVVQSSCSLICCSGMGTETTRCSE